MSVTVFEEILDELLIEQCLAYSIDQFENLNFHVENKRHWDPNLVNDSNSIHIHSIPKEIDLYKMISNAVQDKTGEIASSILCYYGMPNSHISWHNDANYDSAISIYLNRDWNPNYGGLFLYKMEKKIHAVVPYINTGVLLKNGIWHAVSSTTKTAPIRYSIQIFCEPKIKQLNFFKNINLHKQSPPKNIKY
jgi:Rps23 Pro-64 3,4-dihydroxylase Tpa1-like proline 4-hydroxylase